MHSFTQSSYLLTSFSAFYLLSMRREFFFTASFYAPFSLKQFQKMNREWSISIYLEERKTFKKEFVTKNIYCNAKREMNQLEDK